WADHAVWGAACKARPYEKVTRHGMVPSLLIASRCAVASSSDCPPDKNAMPGTAPGTQCLSMRKVFSATSATEARLGDFFPGTAILGLSTMPSRATRL